MYSFGNGGMEKGVATLARNTSDHIEHYIVCLTQSGEMERLLPPETKIIECNKKEGNSVKFLLKLLEKSLLLHVKAVAVPTRTPG